MFAYMSKQKNSKVMKSKDDIVSMFLGLLVVVALVGFLVNFIQRRKGDVNVPGVADDLVAEELMNKTNDEKIVVEQGDSLWKIAERVYGDGYKWTEIAELNELNNPGLLFVGEELLLPKIEKVAIADEGGSIQKERVLSGEEVEYTVEKNDSLWKIAVKFYEDGYRWSEIYEDNKEKIFNPNGLEIGMILTIRGKI